MGTKNLNSATDLITFTRASGGTFLGSDGLIQTATNNVPRIEYDATGAVKGLLIEEARTNIVTYSNDFTTSSWTRYRVSIASNVSGVTAPDGSETVDKMIPNSVNHEHRVWDGVSSTAVGETYSVYAKSAGYDYVWLGYYEDSVYGYAVVNLTNGVVTASNTANYSVEASTNGFYRISVTKTASGTNPRYISISPSPTASPTLNSNNVPSFVGDGTSGIYVWGAQIEAGAFHSSYIPTTGTAATRAADVATIPTSAFGYNQKVGSVLFEGNVIKANIGTTIDRRIVEISDGTTTNFISVYQDVSMDQNLRIANQDAGVLSVNADTGYTLSDAQTFKVAIGIKLNNFAVSVDGGAVVTDTTGTVSNTLSQIDIGKLGGGTQYLNGHIKSIKYYPRRLTNTQLQELTT
jgi:hypothetical protein